MSEVRPRLCLLTGVPGSGKSAIAGVLRPRLPPGWMIIRGDDFIGPTQACYPGRPWPEIRPFLGYFAGWSAGWYLAMGREVLLEGHFRDAEEVDRLTRGVRDLCPSCAPPTTVILRGDSRVFAKRLAENPRREPQWSGPGREENFFAWISSSAIASSVSGQIVDVGDSTETEVARRVADAFGISWS